MGYHEPDWEKSAKKLAADIEHHMTAVHRFFVKRFNPAAKPSVRS
jgi:hypothetical protein